MTVEERNQLVLDHMSLAEKLAWKKARTTPICVQIDELISAAYQGLVDAAIKFNSSKSVPFALYAAIRITGEMKDYLRSLSWAKKKDINVVSVFSKDGEFSIFEILESRNDHEQDTCEFFEDITKNLNEVAKRVVFMYYVQQLTLKEIGLCFQIGESRVSQIITQSKFEMKRKFEKELVA